MNIRKTITILLMLILPAAVGAQEDSNKQKPIELNGYLKDIQSLSFTDNVDSLHTLNFLHNRMNFKFTLPDNFSARMEIRNRVFYGDQIRQIPDFGKLINQYNGLISLSKLWVNEKTLIVQSVIDRLLLQYSTSKWDIQVGRQRINWGINNVWNPNDIFNAYNFLDFDYEERPGNDALRIQYYLSNHKTMEIAFKPSKDKHSSIGAMLYKFNKHKYDFQLLGGLYQHDIVVGGGWAGSLKNAGFKGEISYFHPYNNLTDTAGTVSFSLMADQTFPDDWYLSLSVLFNSHPIDISGNHGVIYLSNLTAKQLFPYRYTFYANMLKSFSPVTSLNFALIYSPENNSIILFPSYALNIAENFDLDITVQSFFAQEMNKYKAQGTSLYIRGKWSF